MNDLCSETRGTWRVNILFVFHYYKIKPQEYILNIPIFISKLMTML